MGTNFRLWDEMTECLTNVAHGLPDDESLLDIHVALIDDDENHQEYVKTQLSILPNVQSVNVILTENAGADIGQFLTQLKETQVGGTTSTSTSTSSPTFPSYEAIIKVHAKSDDQWRQRMLGSLCGSPHQVTSILSQMQMQPNIDLVAALGTTISPRTPVTSIYPRILEIYNMESAEPAFDKDTLQNMNNLFRELGFTDTAIKHPKIVAGSCFWIRWSALQVSKWVSSYDNIQQRLTRGYARNLGLEHVIERLIPSMLTGSIAEITPAPRIFALYFPQYHTFPENDRFWGTNFTEWTLLKPYKPKKGDPPIRKPLPVEDGGLGYYNLLNYDTRKRQAELAKQYGVTGFTYYHYWFSGSHAPENHLIMTGLFDKLLEDGEPDLPFFLSWANEPWNRRWTGQEGEVLLSQEYGDEEEWNEHFMYLLKFFQHPNYEKVNGRPCFAIYRPGHVGDQLKPMLALWHILAQENGFPGLHIIQTVGNFYNEDKTFELSKDADIQASFQFWPQLFASFAPDDIKKDTSSVRDVNLNLGNKEGHIQYWGAFTTFDRRPRDHNAKFIVLRTPQQFDEGLRTTFKIMSTLRGRNIDKNLYFVTAWNEWNEQALLEPDMTYKFSFLEAVYRNVRSVSLNTVTSCGQYTHLENRMKNEFFAKLHYFQCGSGGRSWETTTRIYVRRRIIQLLSVILILSLLLFRYFKRGDPKHLKKR
jgi:hypothetical protein